VLTPGTVLDALKTLPDVGSAPTARLDPSR
jgi:hypothetical protein